MLRCSFLLALFICHATCLKELASGEHTLFNDLFANYSKSIRPAKSWDQKLDVHVNVQVNKVAQVIEQHHTMKIRVRLEMTWIDANLHWQPSKYSNIQSMVIPASQLWIPDIHLFNSATEDDLLFPENVELYFNGTVLTYPLNSMYAHCAFHFERFPFDSQSCQFLVGSMLDTVSVSLNAYKSERMLENPEWKEASVSQGARHSFLMPGTTHHINEAFSYDWSVASFNISVKRSSAFYVNLFIWPLVFVLVLGVGVFILPACCVERVSMGVLLLLSLVILSLMLENITPKSANPSVIARLISFDMFMLTLATVISTLIISIHKDNSLILTKIPQWLKNILLKYIGSIVCKKETLKNYFEDNQILTDSEEIHVIESDRNVVTEPMTDLNQAQLLLTHINNQIAQERKRLRHNETKEHNRNEWYLIAIVLDRMCLLAYTVVALVGLFFILVV